MAKKRKSSIRVLLEISKEGKKGLSFSALLIFISSLCSLGPFYIAYLLIEKIINPPFLKADFINYGIMAALLVVAQMVFSGVAMRNSHLVAYEILFNLRVKLAQKITRLPLGYFDKSSSGLIKKIMMTDIEAVEEFVAHNLVDLLSFVFVPFIIFIWLACYHLPLALLAIFPVIFGVLLQRLRMILEKDTVQNFFHLKGQMNTTIVDFIRGMPVIKAFNQSVYSFKRYQDEAEKYSRYWIDMNKKASGFFALHAVLVDSGVVFLLPIGGYLYATSRIPLGTFLLFMFMGIGLSRFMKQLTNFGSNITQILKGVEQLNNVLQAPEIDNNGIVKALDKHDLEFSGVSFAYEDKTVLENISFVVQPGTITALVGPSGAGKTTTGRLIPRFWDIQTGEITIGGVNIKQIEGDTLTDMVSFVFQDVFMFNDSVLENIRMGDVSLTREQVVEIAKKAQAHEFILRLEHGYDTVIGSQGTYLSGGEQQRISIARALAKDSPIIILDEATSYADTENEDKIQIALNELLKSKTVIVIAHRLSTIQSADQILVFDEGRIVERGNHHELMGNNGVYKQLWDTHLDSSDWGICRSFDPTETTCLEVL